MSVEDGRKVIEDYVYEVGTQADDESEAETAARVIRDVVAYISEVSGADVAQWAIEDALA